jgi:hypothetical protein
MEHFQTVDLPVPAGWRLAALSVGTIQVGCLVRTAAPAPAREQDCGLSVRVVDQWPQGGEIIDPDVPGGLRDRNPDYCPGDGFTDLRPGERRTVTVDRRSGEYRTIVVDCAKDDHVIQQWVFPDHPAVVMVRWAGGSAVDDAAMSVVALHVRLPAGTGKRLADFGHIVGLTDAPTGPTLTFDRVLPRSLWSAADVNDNPTTYQLTPAAGVQIRSAITLCDGTARTTDATGLGIANCPLDTLLQALRKDPVRYAGVPVWLQYGPDGSVGYLVEEYRA